MDHLCYLCLVFVMLSCHYISALWSPAWKGLTSWLSFVMFNCVFCHFPMSGQVRYLIVSIPDLCHLSYIYNLDPVGFIVASSLLLALLFNLIVGGVSPCM